MAGKNFTFVKARGYWCVNAFFWNWNLSQEACAHAAFGGKDAV
jgi:hypothetical protein